MKNPANKVHCDSRYFDTFCHIGRRYRISGGKSLVYVEKNS